VGALAAVAARGARYALDQSRFRFEGDSGDRSQFIRDEGRRGQSAGCRLRSLRDQALQPMQLLRVIRGYLE
jgi:hypothetical protein